MAQPGSRRARYQAVAGDEERRRELYLARRRLFFTIDEWLSLPWWQRRVYIDGMNAETRERQQAQEGRGGGGGQSQGKQSWVSALYPGGDLGQARSDGFTTG